MKFLEFEYNPYQDILTVEGIRYSGEFFRALSDYGLEIGTYFKILDREDGLVTIERIEKDEYQL